MARDGDNSRWSRSGAKKRNPGRRDEFSCSRAVSSFRLSYMRTPECVNYATHAYQKSSYVVTAAHRMHFIKTCGFRLVSERMPYSLPRADMNQPLNLGYRIAEDLLYGRTSCARARPFTAWNKFPTTWSNLASGYVRRKSKNFPQF